MKSISVRLFVVFVLCSICEEKLLAQKVSDDWQHQVDANSLQLTPALINQLAGELETNNPSFLATRARTNAAGAAFRAVKSWEDPSARIGGMAAREELRASDGDLIYGVEQKLPLF